MQHRPSLLALAFVLTLACGPDAEDPGDSGPSDDTPAGPVDVDGDHVTVEDGDCDDNNREVYPGHPEECNGVDDDCNGWTDEGFDDTDEDGIADCIDSEDCDGIDNDGDGRVDEGFEDTDFDGIADCMDSEECDGQDNDGDGDVDEGFDADGDGFTPCQADDASWDCNDDNSAISPAATELEGDGVDNDCDELIDEGSWANGDLLITEVLADPARVEDHDGEWFEIYNASGRDVFLDGLIVASDGDDDESLHADDPISLAAGAYAVVGLNADTSTNGDVALTVIVEGITLSNNSDTLALMADGVELDSVVWEDTATSGASSSLDPTLSSPVLNDDPAAWCPASETWRAMTDFGSPGQPNALCDAVDHDGDGYNILDGDCDDGDAAFNPSATETWYDGIDHDCDGLSDYDADGDGYDIDSAGGTDCDDGNAAVHPDTLELCDGLGIDDDCDGLVDDGFGPGCPGLWGDLMLEDADAKLVGENAEDWAGRGASGAGDVNLDGYDDLLVAAWGNDAGGSEAGAAYLVLGPVTGELDLSLADAMFIGERAGDYAGKPAVGAGDVDGDGYPDILIGAYLQGTGGPAAGAAYLIRGPVTGSVDLSMADAKLIGENAGDESSKHLAGDLDANGDGMADIFIGATEVDRGGTDAGAAYLVLGPVNRVMSLTTADAILVGEHGADSAGRAVSAADVDGDGIDDLLVGAWGEDSGGGDAGAVYVVLGPVSGTFSLSGADAILTGEVSGDYAGKYLAGIGDSDGDGLEDFIVGASRQDASGSNSGAVYLLHGLPPLTSSLATADAKLIGEAASDYAGVSVDDAGDVNADGFADFLVGADCHDTYGSDSGVSYLMFGPVTGTVVLATADVRMYGEAADDRSGHDVSAAGDVDADGFDDVVIGAYGDDIGGKEAGAMYLFLGH